MFAEPPSHHFVITFQTTDLALQDADAQVLRLPPSHEVRYRLDVVYRVISAPYLARRVGDDVVILVGEKAARIARKAA